MKGFRLTTICFVAVLFFSMFVGTSCSNKTKKVNSSLDTIPAVTHEDSMRVFRVTEEFMQLMQSQQVDSALNMLSNVFPNDSAAEITPARKNELKQQFKMMPVLSYEFTTATIESTNKASATYQYKFMENPTTDPNYPCTTSLTLDVIYKTGKYRLVLSNRSIRTR